MSLSPIRYSLYWIRYGWKWHIRYTCANEWLQYMTNERVCEANICKQCETGFCSVIINERISLLWKSISDLLKMLMRIYTVPFVILKRHTRRHRCHAQEIRATTWADAGHPELPHNWETLHSARFSSGPVEKSRARWSDAYAWRHLVRIFSVEWISLLDIPKWSNKMFVEFK